MAFTEPAVRSRLQLVGFLATILGQANGGFTVSCQLGVRNGIVCKEPFDSLQKELGGFRTAPQRVLTSAPVLTSVQRSALERRWPGANTAAAALSVHQISLWPTNYLDICC